MGLLAKIFGDPNEKEIKKIRYIVEQVNSLAAEMKKLRDADFPAKTNSFKERLSRGEDLDDMLPEAFALAREAAERATGMRPFDVQVLGGIVLHQGRVAEMKTGEGKTLVATMPAYLNALTGKGVHIVTVNDYLARRDSEWMGPVYRLLGLQVGLIVHGLNSKERQQAYSADVTYGTNNEFGFDYLRDNMVLRKEQMVQRPLYYAIVDEVDSILIDEARTPLIISGAAEQPTELYRRFAAFVPRLKRDEDYEVDEKANTASLTEKGVAKAEKMLGLDNLSDERNMELSHHLNQALKAHALMKKDRDYVVKDGQIIIVDEFTGRLMFGRRYGEGLHQAIEAKEGVEVKRESRTLASITFQNYFRMYEKLSGMTGTAATEEEEFRKIYGMDVVVIPTNKEMIRQDLPDVIFKTEAAKFKAAVQEIAERYRKGQPVLVGTISIEKSEQLSRLLKKEGIAHQVLNAKYHEKEAEIVAQAGKKGAVTIATNMAGRGTDIVLGGNIESDVEKISNDPDLTAEEKEIKIKELKAHWQKEHDEVVSMGGLHILGTERHESRRIDNQLRGRAGRQGDPGSSQFFVSLEDDLMRLFGSDNIAPLMEKLGMDDQMTIDHPMISRAIENAQKRVESRNFDLRKHILEYDDVLNQQREVIYRQRRQVLEGERLKESILEMLEKTIESALELYVDPKAYEDEWDLEGLIKYGERVFLPPGRVTAQDLQGKSREEIFKLLLELSTGFYEERENELGTQLMSELERVILLRVVDSKWMDHIDAMHQLRQGIGLRAYGQQDPLIQYRYEAFEMFQEMIRSIQEEVVRLVLHVQVSAAPERRAAARIDLRASHPAAGNSQEAGPARKKPITVKKVGRNEPCPCGSGKKYKKCCGKAKE